MRAGGGPGGVIIYEIEYIEAVTINKLYVLVDYRRGKALGIEAGISILLINRGSCPESPITGMKLALFSRQNFR
jgi:hypothetical protein